MIIFGLNKIKTMLEYKIPLRVRFLCQQSHTPMGFQKYFRQSIYVLFQSIVQEMRAKLKKQKSVMPLQEFELVLSEGVHFYNIKEYFLQLVGKFCLLSWLGDTNCYRHLQRKILNASREEKLSHIFGMIRKEGQEREVILQQRKLFLKNEVQYVWMDEIDKTKDGHQIDLQVFFRIEVELGTDRKALNNLIKIQIIKLRESGNTDALFPFFKNITHRSYAYKPNFCEFAAMNQLTFPELREPYMSTGKEQNHLILLLSQNHMKQMPFFNGVIKGILKSGKKLVKIIGHPINLLLVLLINEKHQFNDKIGEIIENYRHLSQNTSNIIPKYNNALMERKLKDLILKILGEQGLLDNSFVQFFSQHLVNQEFQKNFVQLVVLYYKIFLNEQINELSIRLALVNDFYILRDEEMANNTSYFTSILKFIEFKHDLSCKNVLRLVNQEIKISKKKSIQEFTLLDLYRYNKIQYTFIAMDLEDKTVRFFNYHTAPRLPIAAILSLIQIFPTPYKSIIWKQSWGRYKYFSNGTARYLSLVGHQIIDSKYLLECPMDLVSDPRLRQCYFNNNTPSTTRIEAIASARLNVQELKYVQEVKALMKSMKNNAIECLPKFKLVWKILTTKNRVQIDLNNVQTLYQIPILEKILRINETLKNYLRNVNTQANGSRIFKVSLPYYRMGKLQLQAVADRTRRMADLIDGKFGGSGGIFLVNKSEVQLQLQSLSLRKEIEGRKIWTYGEGVELISRAKNIIKGFDIKQKFIYQEKIRSISYQIERHQWIFNIKLVEEELCALLKRLGAAELKVEVGAAVEEADLLRTSRNCETFSFIYEQNEKLAFDTILQQLRTFQRRVEVLHGDERSIQVSMQNVNLQFQRLTHSISVRVFQIMESKVESAQLVQFLGQFFELTPHLYNHKEIMHNRFLTTRLIMDFLRSNDQGKPFHLIIGGHEDTLLLQANHLLSMRVIVQEHKMSKIAGITSNGYHSLLAFLFGLNIKRDALISEIVGLHSLLLTAAKVVEDADIDIMELLAKRIDSQEKLYYFGSGKKLGELRSRVQRKYMNLLSKFTQVESSIQNGNQYKLQKIYGAIERYDAEFNWLSTQLKSQEITRYLQCELQLHRIRLGKVSMLLQNEQMLKEKIVFNKIGLSFFIKFLYSDPAAHLYWYNIHKSEYQQLAYYKLHVIGLFKKYNVDPQITLLQFNRTNYHQVQLSFAFLNQTQLKYEYITGENQSHLKLVDLIIASASNPVFTGAYPLNTHDNSSTHCKAIINKLQGKFEPNFPKKRYWSTGTLNPLPFNIIQAANAERTVLGFGLTHLYSRKVEFGENMLPELRMVHNNSRSMKDQQNRNFKALDLISYWWTKPKKLSPELKQSMFGSIYRSPFCRLYFMILNGCYANLVDGVRQRSILNLNEEGDYAMKQRIVCESLGESEIKGGVFYLKVTQLSDKTVVQCVKCSKDERCWLQCEGQQVTEVSKITINQCLTNLKMILRRIDDDYVREYTVVIGSIKCGSGLFLEIKVSSMELIVVNQLILKSKELIRNELPVVLSQKNYKFKMCASCGEPILIKSDQSEANCPLCFKRKQFKLCLLLSESSQANFDNVIEEIRQKQVPERRQTKSKFSRYICCLGCYNKA